MQCLAARSHVLDTSAAWMPGTSSGMTHSDQLPPHAGSAIASHRGCCAHAELPGLLCPESPLSLAPHDIGQFMMTAGMARGRTSTAAMVVTPATTVGGGAAAAVDAASVRTADMTALGSPELVAVVSDALIADVFTAKLDGGGFTCIQGLT